MPHDTWYPEPKGSFQQPAPLITTDPDLGDQVCVRFGAAWLPMVRGALLQLFLESTWDTSDPDALQLVRDRVNTLFYLFSDDMAACAMFDIRLKPTDHCVVQKTTDGVTWTDAFSLYACGHAAGLDAIQEKIDDGTLGTRGQQGPHGAPAPQECTTFNVTLRGNDRWICPFPISTGYTVHVTDATGGWFDGEAIPAAWECPTGKIYFLGICGADVPYKLNDPLQAGNHMQIVGNHGSVWFDPFTLYTVPGGHYAEALYLQANDAPISDNQGSVQFKVEVCTPAGGWCYKFDFATSPYNERMFLYSDQHGPHGVYDTDAWSTVQYNHYGHDVTSLRGRFHLATEYVNYYLVDLEWEVVSEGGDEYGGWGSYEGGQNIFDYLVQGSGIVHQVYDVYPGSGNAMDLWFDNQCYDFYGQLRLKSITIAGAGGTNPFGADNCGF